MPSFFIDRPIFAWVVAIFIMLAGVIAIPFLPVAQYPNVAPPQISVTTNYPGATPAEMYQSVTRPIEEELNGVPGLIYFDSASDASGRMPTTVTIEPGTPIGVAQGEDRTHAVQGQGVLVRVRLGSDLIFTQKKQQPT